MSVLELAVQQIPEGCGLTMESITRFMVYGESPEAYTGEFLEWDIGKTFSHYEPKALGAALEELILTYASNDLEYAIRAMSSNAFQIFVRGMDNVNTAGRVYISIWIASYLDKALRGIRYRIIPHAYSDQLALCA